MAFANSDVKNGVDNKGFHMQEHDTVRTAGQHDFSSVNVENVENSLNETNFLRMTTEAFPRLENYRNSRRTAKRPSLGELHGQNDDIKVSHIVLFLLNYFGQTLRVYSISQIDEKNFYKLVSRKILRLYLQSI